MTLDDLNKNKANLIMAATRLQSRAQAVVIMADMLRDYVDLTSKLTQHIAYQDNIYGQLIKQNSGTVPEAAPGEKTS